jgi:hypothetical protein
VYVLRREKVGLIVAEINREWHAVLQESHERDLNGVPCSIHYVTELHDVDRALDGSRPDGTTNEYVAAASRGQKQ